MQKKLIALAIAGLSGAAFAQSNVTVYGVADATYDFVSVSGGSMLATDTAGARPITSTNSAANYNQSFSRVSTNSSLIGFKGVEDLGNGLKAVFQYESAVGFDVGGALGTSRDSFVALAGGFGTVALGNLTGPTRAFGAAVDVNDGATGVGANSALLGKLGNILTGALDTAGTGGGILGSGNQITGGAVGCTRSSTCTSAFDTRFKNAIAYISPDMGGFTAIAGYVPNEGKSTAANPSAWDLGLKYANGPILGFLSHADVKLKNSATTTSPVVLGALLINGGATAATLDLGNAHATDTRLGGSYDFGVASVRALWDQTKLSINSASDIKQTVWGIGGTFNPMPAGKIIAQYYKAGDVDLGGKISGTGAKLWEIGYEHSLSKRTMVKAVYSRLQNDSGQIYDFGVNATGMTNSVSGTITTGNYGATLSALQIGLRHKF